ncbi:hypothetical protein GLP27_12440 [Photobacterium carnosum]|nr:hypothetical protein [Photobacterium carnosum]
MGFFGKINLGFDPQAVRDYYDPTLPQESGKVTHFCLMCRPQFCSMKISQEVRDYTKTLSSVDITVSDNPRVGMEQKAVKFRARGSELYHPAKRGLTN